VSRTTLLIPQGLHGIHPHGATRRNEARRQHDHAEQEHDGPEPQPVVAADNRQRRWSPSCPGTIIRDWSDTDGPDVALALALALVTTHD